jgi:hypothetical protein
MREGETVFVVQDLEEDIADKAAALGCSVVSEAF